MAVHLGDTECAAERSKHISSTAYLTFFERPIPTDQKEKVGNLRGSLGSAAVIGCFVE